MASSWQIWILTLAFSLPSCITIVIGDSGSNESDISDNDGIVVGNPEEKSGGGYHGDSYSGGGSGGHHGGRGSHGSRGGHSGGGRSGGYARSQIFYGGQYGGRCGKDGFYYNDDYSFVTCSHGIAYVQRCAPGTRNGPMDSYSAGGYYSHTSFCGINLVDYGYAAYHSRRRPSNRGYSSSHSNRGGYGSSSGYGHSSGGYGGSSSSGYGGSSRGYESQSSGYGSHGNQGGNNGGRSYGQGAASHGGYSRPSHSGGYGQSYRQSYH